MKIIQLMAPVFLVLFFVLIFAVFYFLKAAKRRQLPENVVSDLLELDLESPALTPKALVDWPVAVTTAAGEEESARMMNFGQGNAFLGCRNPLPVGSRFRVSIQAPNRPVIAADAEVVWNNGHVPANRVVNRGMSIRFIGINESDRRFLNETIASQVSARDRSAGA